MAPSSSELIDNYQNRCTIKVKHPSMARAIFYGEDAGLRVKVETRLARKRLLSIG